jgi:uncharacterized protein
MSLSPLVIARSGSIELGLLPALANRHGLITGATGTGKTVSLQVLAEQFSAIGVPVFMADVKGDLAGISQAGTLSPKLAERLQKLGMPTPNFAGSPVTLWDVFGEQGHPMRATVSEMGPLLLSRMLDLNDVQEGVLHLVFRIADDQGMLLLDTKDLRAMLSHVGEHAKEYIVDYGNISAASVGSIQRGLLMLEDQGGDKFFGEPALNLADLLQTVSGKGVINVLSADKLLSAPRLYASFLLWLLSELYEAMPEVGDLDKPKLVFFFDEAHLLFNDAPKALLEKVEQVVRLVRSKGIGVYFVTQNPLDIPQTVLGQLGNRIQHALRAYTPRDQEAVKTAADTMRQNPAFSAAQAITELAVGEALVSFLDEKGRPCVVERAYIAPPASQIGPVTPEQRAILKTSSLVAGVYDQTLDRESAYERLRGKASGSGPVAGNTGAQEPSLGERVTQGLKDSVTGVLTGSGRKDSIVEAVAKSAARSIGSSVGRAIVRGLMGSLLGGRRR